MATSIFLLLTNSNNVQIKGESTVTGVVDPWLGTFPVNTVATGLVDVTSVNVAAVNTATIGSTGVTVGKVSLHPVEVVIPTCIVTPDLFGAIATGLPMSADIMVTKSGAAGTAPQTYLTYRVTRATLVGYEDAVPGVTGPSTKFQMVPSSFQVAYRPQKPDGTFGTWVRKGWDVVKNVAV